MHQKEKGKEESLSCCEQIGGALGLILRRSRFAASHLCFWTDGISCPVSGVCLKGSMEQELGRDKGANTKQVSSV